jgi:hypothetical protein
MSTSKKSTSKKLGVVLPRWFRIEKYEGAASFRPLDWYKQLRVRLLCAARFDPKWKFLFDTVANPDVNRSVINALDAIRKDPLAPHPAIEALIRDDLSALSPERVRDVMGVHSLTIRELYEYEMGIEEGWRKAMKECLAQTPAAKIFDGTLDQEWMSGSVYLFLSFSNARVLASVDLGLPDLVLTAQFADWLRTTRHSIRNATDVPRYRFQRRRVFSVCRGLWQVRAAGR